MRKPECSRCGKMLEPELYGKQKYCRECCRTYMREYMARYRRRKQEQAEKRA